jgi:hypothetical protein
MTCGFSRRIWSWIDLIDACGGRNDCPVGSNTRRRYPSVVQGQRTRAKPTRLSRLNAWSARLNEGATRFESRAHKRLLVSTGGFYNPLWFVLFLLDAAAWAAVLIVDRPPRWMVFAAVPLAAMTWCLTIGVVLVFGRKDRFDSARARTTFLGLMAETWSAFLAPAAIACAGIESWAHPNRVNHPLTYVNSMLWNAADIVPLVDVPRLLHQSDPPVRTWGMGAGTLFILSDVLMAATVLVWARELWREVLAGEPRSSPNRND